MKSSCVLLAILGLASLTSCKEASKNDGPKFDLGAAEGAGPMWKGVLIAAPDPEFVDVKEEEASVQLGKGPQEDFQITKDNGDFAREVAEWKESGRYTFLLNEPNAVVVSAQKNNSTDYISMTRVDLGQGLVLTCTYLTGIIGKKELAEKTVSICRTLQRK